MSEWRDDAACIGTDPDAFFLEKGPGYAASVQTLKGICSTCEVRDACLADAMAQERGLTRTYRFGIYGGLTPTERADLSRGVQPLADDEPACREAVGTYGGYQRHVSRHQTPCEPCKKARNDYAKAARKSRAKVDPVTRLAAFEAALDFITKQPERMAELDVKDAAITICPVCDQRVIKPHEHAMEVAS